MSAAMKWLQFAWLNTRRNGRRSAVTLAIAALGTAAMLLAGGFAIFTYQSLAQSAARSTGHLVIAKAEQFTKDEDQPLQHGMEGWESMRQRMLLDADVRQVLPRVEFSGLISNGDKSTVMMGSGIDPDAEFAIKGPFLTIKEGAALTSGQGMAVMLGEGLARNLKAKPGDMLTLLASTTAGAMNAIDVQVQGVFSTGIAEMDKRALYIDVKSAQALLDTQRISSLGVFLKGMEATDAAQARMHALLPELTVRTWLDQAMFYRSVKQLYDRIFGALGMIIAVIVIFVVSNAMAMAIIERTREIGTLRALGTLPGQLQRTLALEGMLLGGGGAVLGALLSLGFSLFLMVVPVNMPPPPGYSKGYPLNIAIDPQLYALTLAAMLVLALLASAWVARKTVRLPIVAALAHT